MSRSPNGHPELSAPLRIAEFYNASDFSRQLRETLKPDTRAARTAPPPGLLEKLQNNIEVSIRDAENFYVRHQFADCSVHLHAAKANQVALLGKIDDMSDGDMSAARRTALHSSCVALGSALTKLMVKADSLANLPLPGNKRSAPESESNGDSPPPGSPDGRNTTQETASNTPARSPKKRVQGGPDSPVQKPSSPKRQKIDTPPPAPATTASSATTTTATTAPASLPTYRAVPRLNIESDIGTASSSTTATALELHSPGSPTVKKSSQKSRPLSPQPRPRPASQLFQAPPDFTGMAHDRTTPGKPVATAAPTPEPGKSDAGNSDQHS